MKGLLSSKLRTGHSILEHSFGHNILKSQLAFTCGKQTTSPNGIHCKVILKRRYIPGRLKNL